MSPESTTTGCGSLEQLRPGIMLLCLAEFGWRLIRPALLAHN